MRATIVALIAVPLCGLSYAQSPAEKPAFEFRSHKIGDSLSAKYPNWAKGRPNVLKGPGCELYERSEGVITCDDAASFTTTQGLTYQRIGDAVVSSLR